MSSKTRAGRLAAAAASADLTSADATATTSLAKPARLGRGRDAPAASSAGAASAKPVPEADKVSLFSKALQTAQDPSSWNCAECGSTNHVWISLGDGTAHCEEAGHAAAHFAAHKGQPLYIGIQPPHEVKNLATGSTVKPGMQATDDVAIVSAIATVRGRLRSMHSLGGKQWSESKGWAKLRAAVFLFGIPFMTREAQLQRKRRDAQATAVARWQQLELFRAFRSWRSKAAAMTAAAAGAGAGSASSAASTAAVPTSKAAAAAVGAKRSRSRATAGDGEETPTASASTSALPQPLLSAIPDSAAPFFPAPKTAFEMKARRGHTGLRNLGELKLSSASEACRLSDISVAIRRRSS